MTCGIYSIKCLVSNTIYIGSSSNIKERFKNHKRNLNKNKHHNIYLQRSWNKYHPENFIFKEECIVCKEDLLEFESLVLETMFSTNSNIFNISKSATSPMLGRKHTKEWIEKSLVWKKGNKSRTGQPASWSKDNPPPSLTKMLEISKNPSTETRQKMSAAKKGKPPNNKGKKFKICPEGHRSYVEESEIIKECKKCLKLRK